MCTLSWGNFGGAKGEGKGKGKGKGKDRSLTYLYMGLSYGRKSKILVSKWDMGKEVCGLCVSLSYLGDLDVVSPLFFPTVWVGCA